MDDFRKPYEYTEEKRGMILIFIFSLLTFDLLQAPMYIVPTFGLLKQISALSIAFLILSIPYVLFILFTAVTCYKLKRNMVTLSKIYLITRVVFLGFCIIILYINDLNTRTLSGRHYSNVGEITIRSLIIPLAIDLTFSILWFLYFSKSKRCREIMMKKA